VADQLNNNAVLRVRFSQPTNFQHYNHSIFPSKAINLRHIFSFENMETNTAEPSLEGVGTVIDPAGDMILKVDKTTLLVNSKVLSIASPVFRAMLGPNFQEGVSLTQKGL
jgi:hypothetical protein